jgi:hypothetical protein
MSDKRQQSWDNCEEWYRIQIQEKQQIFLIPMLEFVQEIRSLGYDEIFYLRRFGIHPYFSHSINVDTTRLMMIRVEATGTISVKLRLNNKVFELEEVKLELSPELRTLLEIFAAYISDEV